MISVTLDNFKFPNLAEYPIKFGKKTTEHGGSLTTREISDDISMPFETQRPIIVSTTDETTDIEYNANFQLHANEAITLTLGAGKFTGCKVKVVNISDTTHSVKYQTKTFTVNANTILTLIWDNSKWVDLMDSKVDKVSGKGLSANDFTDDYKQFIDDYTVDTALDSSSENPVQNKVIKTEVDKKVDIAQGADNAGKVLKIQSDGNVGLGEGLPTPTAEKKLLISKETEGILGWQEIDENSVGGNPLLTEEQYEALSETEKMDGKIRGVEDDDEVDFEYSEIDDTATTTENTWSADKINGALAWQQIVGGSYEEKELIVSNIMNYKEFLLILAGNDNITRFAGCYPTAIFNFDGHTMQLNGYIKNERVYIDVNYRGNDVIHCTPQLDMTYCTRYLIYAR